MRILFIYPNLARSKGIQMGIAHLASYLKNGGHEVELLDLTWGWEKREAERIVKQFGPDIIGFSVRSLEFEYSINIAKFMKRRFNIPILFGGIHPTIVPEETIRSEPVDMICIGEGEQTTFELLEKMKQGGDIRRIQGLWVKDNSEIFRNPVRPLKCNLDDFPFPDRELFDKKHIILEYPGSPVMTTRGCPFHCTYCVNHTLQDLYNRKNFVRYREIDNVLEEIRIVQESYNIKCISFIDETFTISKKRVLEFCEKYREEINLPFRCMARADTVDKEMIFALKEAGCIGIHIGIESGNDFIRNQIMKRGMSKQQIINAFKWVKETEIGTASYNMIGLPEETRDMIMDTVKLNKKCLPDLIQVTIFYPYVGTTLWKYCKNKGYLPLQEECVKTHYEKSILTLPTLGKKEIFALQKVFPLYCRSSYFFWPAISLLEKLIRYSPSRLSKVYHLGFLFLSKVFRHLKAHKTLNWESR